MHGSKSQVMGCVYIRVGYMGKVIWVDSNLPDILEG